MQRRDGKREERDDKIKGLKVDARDQGEEPSREPFSHTKGRVFAALKLHLG